MLKVISKPAAWDTCRSLCQEHGGDLVSIHDEEQNKVCPSVETFCILLGQRTNRRDAIALMHYSSRIQPSLLGVGTS